STAPCPAASSTCTATCPGCCRGSTRSSPSRASTSWGRPCRRAPTWACCSSTFRCTPTTSRGSSSATRSLPSTPACAPASSPADPRRPGARCKGEGELDDLERAPQARRRPPCPTAAPCVEAVSRRSLAVYERVDGRDQEQGDERGRGEAPQDGAGQRRLCIRPLAEAQRQRKQAEHR